MRHLILKWSSFKNVFFSIFRLPNGLLIRLDRGVDKSQVEHLNLPFKSSGGNNEAKRPRKAADLAISIF